MPKRNLSDLVLDTIDTISARKNRPNLVRIYRHLHRLYDLTLGTCESLLQSLLKEGRVIRVTYKGHISYRNAQKWKRYSYYMKRNMGSDLPSSLLTNAISELVVQEPDYLSMGVPCNVLEQHLLTMHKDNINKEAIHKLLQRELKLESLLRLDNGNYFIGPKPVEFLSSGLGVESENLNETAQSKLPISKAFQDPNLNGSDINSLECPELTGDVKKMKLDNEKQMCAVINIDLDNLSSTLEDGETNVRQPVKNKENALNTLNGYIEKYKNFTNDNEAHIVTKVIDESRHALSSEKDFTDNKDVNDGSDPFTDYQIFSEIFSKKASDDGEKIGSMVDINKVIGINCKGDVETSSESLDNSPGKVKTADVVPEPSSTSIEKQSDEEKELQPTSLISERVQRKKVSRHTDLLFYFILSTQQIFLFLHL